MQIQKLKFYLCFIGKLYRAMEQMFVLLLFLPISGILTYIKIIKKRINKNDNIYKLTCNYKHACLVRNFAFNGLLSLLTRMMYIVEIKQVIEQIENVRIIKLILNKSISTLLFPKRKKMEKKLCGLKQLFIINYAQTVSGCLSSNC